MACAAVVANSILGMMPMSEWQILRYVVIGHDELALNAHVSSAPQLMAHIADGRVIQIDRLPEVFG